MTVETYWISKTFVADWTILDIATGLPLDGVTVTGTVSKPDLTSTSMVITAVGGGTGKYRATYDPTLAGRHGYRLVATGLADGAEEGTFTVHTSLVGALPITVDPTTAIGQVRLLITDFNEVSPLFTDPQITAFLTLESDNVRLAAAQALDTIASSEALVSKKIRTLDLQTDGPAVAKELRERATALREQAAGIDPITGDPFALDIVDYDPDTWLLVGD